MVFARVNSQVSARALSRGNLNDVVDKHHKRPPRQLCQTESKADDFNNWKQKVKITRSFNHHSSFYLLHHHCFCPRADICGGKASRVHPVYVGDL